MTDAHAKAVKAARRTFGHATGPSVQDDWNAAITSYLATMRAEGWVMVPVEPTREMWAASANVLVSDRNGPGSGAHHDHISNLVWGAMLKGAGDGQG